MSRDIKHACIPGQHVWFIERPTYDANGWTIPQPIPDQPFNHDRCLCGQMEWRHRNTNKWILLVHTTPLRIHGPQDKFKYDNLYGPGRIMSDATKAPDFAEHVHTLKVELQNAMRPCLARFRERTGVTPRNIRCNMIDVSVQTDMPTYMLGEIKVEFEL